MSVCVTVHLLRDIRLVTFGVFSLVAISHFRLLLVEVSRRLSMIIVVVVVVVDLLSSLA